MSLPSVNIMIPTYNQAAVIGQALESALAQDYANLKVIVADDCSTDNTWEVVAEYASKNPGRLVAITNEKNLGRVANYRKCLYEYADADWVVNLDGDDHYTDPSFISHAVSRIQEAGVNNALFYQGSHIWKRGDETNDFTFQMPDDERRLPAREYFQRFYELRYFSHMSTVYNRRLAMESGFYELDSISSDLHSFLRVCLRNPDKKVILSKKPTGYWIHTDSNASQTKSLRTNLKNMEMYPRLFRTMRENGWGMVESTRWTANAIWHYAYAYLMC